ncbi:hypothetical protein QJ133_05555 [Priestia megaterium]|nr:hypothetical protein [Priestia megaterium]MDI3090627.1 hypothetical protein [Priestia megaterium]
MPPSGGARGAMSIYPPNPSNWLLTALQTIVAAPSCVRQLILRMSFPHRS